MNEKKPIAAPSEDSLERYTRRTLQHYENNAASFAEGTRDHDVSQNVAALLGAIEGPGPYSILDFGCGPGRDLATFRRLGHEAVGLDGTANLVAIARAESGCEVWHQNFLALDLPAERFHGIFANASMFHIPTDALPRVLTQLRATLRPRGVLFTSNPHGQGQEGYNQERYGAYHSLEGWRALVSAAGFEEIEHYYRPAGRPRAEQPWLATVWRRIDALTDSP